MQPGGMESRREIGQIGRSAQDGQYILVIEERERPDQAPCATISSHFLLYFVALSIVCLFVVLFVEFGRIALCIHPYDGDGYIASLS